MNATFAPGRPPAGRIAFASQSGAYGIAALELCAQRGLGLSSFVSMGDKADLSGNDFLRFWEQDPGTDVVLLYLESLGNPRRFGQIARRLTASKPVIAVKSGRTVAGRRAASSHTGALLEASRGHRRRPLRPRRRDPRRDARRAARRRRAARAPAAARRQPRRDRDQRRRPGDRLRRRVRRGRPARRAATGRHPQGPARAAAAGGVGGEPRRHARRRDEQRLPPRDRDGRRRPRRRRDHRDLHPGAAGPRGGSGAARDPHGGAARSPRTESPSQQSSWPPAAPGTAPAGQPDVPVFSTPSTPRARSGTRRDTRIAAAIRRRPPSRRPTSIRTAPRQ